MPNSGIAIGGVLKTLADEERLVDALHATGLPIQMGDEGCEMSADEPPNEGSVPEWYQDMLDQCIDAGRIIILEAWVDDDDLFESTRGLESVLKDLGLSWRVFDNGLSKVDEAHNGVSGQPAITLHVPGGPAGGETVLVDLVREPLVRVPRPFNEAGQAELMQRVAATLRVLDYPLPALTRAFEPE